VARWLPKSVSPLLSHSCNSRLARWPPPSTSTTIPKLVTARWDTAAIVPTSCAGFALGGGRGVQAHGGGGRHRGPRDVSAVVLARDLIAFAPVSAVCSTVDRRRRGCRQSNERGGRPGRRCDPPRDHMNPCRAHGCNVCVVDSPLRHANPRERTSVAIGSIWEFRLEAPGRLGAGHDQPGLM
jgi:hypothetical protein